MANNYDDRYAKWPSFSNLADSEGKVSPEFARYLDELIERLNYYRVIQFDGANPNSNVEANKGQFVQDNTGDLWIKTTDGADTGWSKVGTQV